MTGRSAMVVGGVCGLAWAASLRGWMAEFAGPERSTVTWLTMLLILAPGTVVGTAFGRAALLRAQRRPVGRTTVLAPVLFASAILDPAIAHSLVSTGQGGGALFVVLAMLAGGYAVGRRRWGVLRVIAVAGAGAGIAGMFVAGGSAAGLTSPRGLWVALFGAALLTVGALASAIPYGAAPLRR